MMFLPPIFFLLLLVAPTSRAFTTSIPPRAATDDVSSRRSLLAVRSAMHRNDGTAQEATMRSKKSRASSVTHNGKRLSDVEHEECLTQVLELRRIQEILRQHMVSLVLQKSQLCGYGEDIEAFENAMRDGEHARESLITHHIPLVHSVVKDIVRNRKKLQSITYEDLVQEGVIGLSRALEKYDPQHKTKLSTYSVFWIRAIVLRAIAEKDTVIYIPSHMQQITAKLNKMQHWEEAQQAKQIALGVTDGQFREAVKLQQRTFVSMEDAWERDLMDTTEDDTPIGPAYLKQALAGFLRPKEVEALSWRYGLNENGPPMPSSGGRWGEAMSFTEVGKQMHVSAEYGRKLCHRALKKLQQAVDEGSLELGLLMP